MTFMHLCDYTERLNLKSQHDIGWWLQQLTDGSLQLIGKWVGSLNDY